MIHSSDRKFKFGVIGIGRMGRYHVDNMLRHPNINLLGCAHHNVSKFSKEMIEKYKIQTIDELLSLKNLDAICIFSPTDRHTIDILMCLESGIPVFSEKPIANTGEEIEKCYKLAKEKNLPLFCAFNKRFDNGNIELKKRIANGEIGKVTNIRLVSRDYPTPPAKNLKGFGSIFEDFCIHEIDQANYFLNPNGDNPVEEIYAKVGNYLPDYKAEKIHDCSIIYLRYKNGEMAVLENNRKSHHGIDYQVEIMGMKGMLRMEGYAKNRGLVMATEGGLNTPMFNTLFDRYDESYRNELDKFVDVLIDFYQEKYDEKLVPVSMEECLNNIDIIRKCEKSIAKNPAIELSFPVPESLDFAEKDLNKERIGIAVLGSNRMATIRANNLRSRKDIDLLYNIAMKPSVDRFASEFGTTPLQITEENLNKVLKDPKVDVVVIASPSEFHYEQTVKALENGKHIFVEKPITLKVSETNHIAELSEKTGLKVYCAMHRRSDPSFRILKRKLEKKQIETIYIISREGATMQNEADFYVFISLIHDIDFGRWLANENPVQIFCSLNSYKEKPEDKSSIEAITCMMTFPSGIICTIENHRCASYGYDQRVEVQCVDELLKVENEKDNNVVSGTIEGLNCMTTKPMERRYYEAYDQEIHHFVDYLKGMEKPRVTARDNVFNTIVAEACLKSISERKARYECMTTKPMEKRYYEAYDQEIHHFVDYLKGMEKPRVTARDNVFNTIVAEACLKSISERKARYECMTTKPMEKRYYEAYDQEIHHFVDYLKGMEKPRVTARDNVFNTISRSLFEEYQ